jgi:hypothetical protein
MGLWSDLLLFFGLARFLV